MAHSPFDQLVKEFAHLPGLGPRSAKRIALHLLTKGRSSLEHFAQTLNETAAQMRVCDTCGNLDMIQPCSICQDTKRDPGQLCIIATVGDLWAIERAGSYRGTYHILGGLLSAIDGITPDQLALSSLEDRLTNAPVNEVILALSATVDGQTTAHYVTDTIMRHHNQISITRLAHGMPVGGELDYLDDGTIMTAFKSRRSV